MWDAVAESLRTQLSQQWLVGAISLALIGMLAASLRRIPAALFAQLRRALVVTATIDSRSDVFAAFLGWIDAQRVGRRSRWFTAVQAPAGAGDDGDDDLPTLLYSPAPGFHVFWAHGRPMWLTREIAMNLQVVETIHLSALFASRRHLERLLEAAVRHAGERRANRLEIHVIDRWGEQWTLADTKPRRPLASVVLDDGVAERLAADIRRFFERRRAYAELGIPWRRGYLLHGPPGTGKTSVAYALAGELRLKLCTLSLTNPKLTDPSLADLLQRTPRRSLILIEDVDAFFVARHKQDAAIAVSFSGLLNALDGVGAQEGRIVVLTTNHRERLDPALIRPGRIDVEIELRRAGPAQLRGLLARFHPTRRDDIERLAADYPPRALSPAQVQQALLAHADFDDAAAALRAAWSAAGSAGAAGGEVLPVDPGGLRSNAGLVPIRAIERPDEPGTPR